MEICLHSKKCLSVGIFSARLIDTFIHLALKINLQQGYCDKEGQLCSWSFAGALLVFLLMVEPFLSGNNLIPCSANAPKGRNSPTEMPYQDENVWCPVPRGVREGEGLHDYPPRLALSLENSCPLHLLSVLVWDLRIRLIYGHLLRTLKKRLRWFYRLVFCLQHYGKITKLRELLSPERRPDQLSGTGGLGKGCHVVADCVSIPSLWLPTLRSWSLGEPTGHRQTPNPWPMVLQHRRLSTSKLGCNLDRM